MLWVSIFTTLTGLIEPIFVPRYWSPPSLFNLALATHFDIESLVFSWGTGGLGSVLYEASINVSHQKMADGELKRERRWVHLASLCSLPVVFGLTYFFTNLNPIYCLSLALFVGALSAVICRPDLVWNTLVGGLLFMSLYFILFFFVLKVSPGFIKAWNFSDISGILVLGVPVEELMYAFTFGMMWSGVYEHIRHYTLR